MKVTDIFGGHERRIKIIQFDPAVFLGILKTGMFIECLEGLPDKTLVKNAGFDKRLGVFYIIVENLEFDQVPEGETLPEFRASLKGYYGQDIREMRSVVRRLESNI